MTAHFISIEGIIPASGDYDQDHEIMGKIKPAVDELKKVLHAVGGSVTVKPLRKKAPNNTATIPDATQPALVPPVSGLASPAGKGDSKAA